MTLKVKCSNKALSSLQTNFHDVARNGTRGREVRETYLGGISTARSGKMNDGSSDMHVVRVEYSGDWLELKNTKEKKWRLRLSPYSSTPLPTPALLAVFSLRL